MFLDDLLDQFAVAALIGRSNQTGAQPAAVASQAWAIAVEMLAQRQGAVDQLNNARRRGPQAAQAQGGNPNG